MSDAHFQRGALLLQQDRYDLAADCFRMALAGDPRHAAAHAMLALCLVERERYDDAEAEARQAVGFDPAGAYPHYVLGMVMLRRNRRDEARAALTEAIELDPEDADYRQALAQVEASLERWTECLATADAGLALDPHHAGCLNLRALALTHLGRGAEAEAVIAGALARNPQNALSHVNQGWTLLHAGEHKQAREHFREALRLQPDNEWAKRGLVEAIKARNPAYRLMLAWFLWMARRSPRVRWGIVIGMFCGLQALAGFERNHPEHSAWAWPLVLVLVAFAWSTWLATPLSNLVLRLHRDGRHALSADQRGQATLVGLCLAGSAAYAGYVYVTPHHPWVLVLAMLVLAMPITGIHSCNPGWPRRAMAAICVVLGLVAIGDAVAAAYAARLPVEQANPIVRGVNATLDPYFIAIIVSQFAANILNRVLPTR